MKRLVLVTLFTVFALNALSWNRVGHAVAVAVAQRHLTEETKKNIAKYIDYDLKDDASWMDLHRKDPEISYTHHWHSYYVDENFNHDPNTSSTKLRFGDSVRAMQVCESTLRNNRRVHLTDSAVVMSLRILIHVLPDMHCPVHVRYNHLKNPEGSFNVLGKEYEGFHKVYDSMPSIIWNQIPADEVAATIDTASASEIRQIVDGNIYDWITDIAKKNISIYDIRPTDSFELVNTQLRNAGYRLAYLLNLYFGE